MAEAPIPSEIGRAEVDACIARRAFGLRFSSRLEAFYEQETGAERCRQLFRVGIVGMLIFESALLPDCLILGDILHKVLWVQLGIGTPLLLALLCGLLFQPKPVVREFGLGVAVLLATGITAYLACSSSAPDRWVMPQVYVVTFLYFTLMQRPRFTAAVITCLCLYLLCVLTMRMLPMYSPVAYLASTVIYLTASGMALYGTYMAERQVRLSYLYSLLSRMQNHELGRISGYDPLTGLGNRRLLDEVVARCRQGDADAPLSVIVLDIDHFKRLNDSAGHQSGDQCLVRIAGIIQGELRGPADHAFRYGGEEFVVLLQGASQDEVVAVAQRIRVAIEGAGMPNPGMGLFASVTASLGVATEAGGAGLSTERLVAIADAALYSAKRAGRNQVWVAQGEVTMLAV